MVLKYKSVYTVYFQIQLQRCKSDMSIVMGLQCCSNGMVTSYIEISHDHNDSSTRLTEKRRWCTLFIVSREYSLRMKGLKASMVTKILKKRKPPCD